MFSQKNYTTIIRTHWATKYESSRENESWATCHNISNLFDGCWHPWSFSPYKAKTMFENASTFSRKPDIRSPKWTKRLRKIMKTKTVTRKKVILNFFFYRSLSLKFCVVCFGIIVFLRFFSTSTCSSSKIRPSLPIFKLGNSPFQKFIIVFTREMFYLPLLGRITECCIKW